MLRKRIVLTSTLLAFLGAPAVADAQAVVRPSSVAASATVPAGGASTLALRCPHPAVALNAAVTSKGAGVTVRRSVPGDDANDWSFRLAATGAGSRRVRAVLRCVSLAPVRGVAGARLAVSTRTARNTSIAPGDATTFRLGCGRAWIGTGYGFSPGAGDRVRIAAAVPGPHGWRFRLENVGSRPARPVVSARCLRRVATADGGERLSFSVKRREFTDTVGPGAATFAHGCGSGWFSLAAGSAVDVSSPITLAGAFPSGARGGRWLFRRAGAGDEVTSHLVCLARSSSFR